MILKKYFFMLMNNSVFGKTMENVRKHGDTEFAAIKRRRNYLVLEPSLNTLKFFIENLQAIEIEKLKHL